MKVVDCWIQTSNESTKQIKHMIDQGNANAKNRGNEHMDPLRTKIPERGKQEDTESKVRI